MLTSPVNLLFATNMVAQTQKSIKSPETQEERIIPKKELPSHQLTWTCTDPVERLPSSWKEPFCTSMLAGGRVKHKDSGRVNWICFPQPTSFFRKVREPARQSDFLAGPTWPTCTFLGGLVEVARSKLRLGRWLVKLKSPCSSLALRMSAS